jgi:sporulation protein YlmC with PRC-barrel domain
MLRKFAAFTVALPLMAGGLCFAEDRMPAKGSTEVTKTTETRDPMATGMHARLSSFMKKDVHNAQGKDIGDIKDVVLDGNGNRVSYVVVSYGGFLGMGDKLFAVPWTAFDFRHDGDKDDAKNKMDLENYKVHLTIADEHLKNAPGFNQDKWPDMADEKFRSEVDAYYRQHSTARDAQGGLDTRMNQTGEKMDVNVRPGEDRSKVAEVTVDRNKAPSDKGLMWTRRATNVIGADVHNKANEDIGKISDLVVDTHSGRISYAVLSYGGFLGMGDKLFAVPMNNLATKADDDKFVMDVTKDRLKGAPGFDKSNWPDFASADFRKGVDSFYGNRQTEAKTPMD